MSLSGLKRTEETALRLLERGSGVVAVEGGNIVQREVERLVSDLEPLLWYISYKYLSEVALHRIVHLICNLTIHCYSQVGCVGRAHTGAYSVTETFYELGLERPEGRLKRCDSSSHM